MTQNNEREALLDKLLAEYFDIAYSEGNSGLWHGKKLQSTLNDIRKLFKTQSTISQNEQQEVNVWKHFDKEYKKACESSQPKDWHQAAMYAQQVRNLFTSPHKQIPDEWVADPDTIPSQLIEITRQAICLEFGDSGTDGYYKRILAKIFKAMLNAASPTSLTRETNTEVVE